MIKIKQFCRNLSQSESDDGHFTLQVEDRKSSLERGFRPGGRGEAGGDWASWSRRAAQRAAAEWTHGGRSHDGAGL